MSLDTIKTAIGDDGIKLAADALKQLASGRDIHGLEIAAETQLNAATTLLSYGLAEPEQYGNANLR
jgi:hypothetical protein